MTQISVSMGRKPAVVDFIDNVVYSRGREMRLENFDITVTSRLIDMDVGEVRDRTGVTTLAIQKKGDILKLNPPRNKTIKDGDKLIVIGIKA